MANSVEKVHLKRKKKSDCMPDRLKSANLGDLNQSVVTLLIKIQNDDSNKSQLTPERVLKILVRGLGSSNLQVQKNYFATLVFLLQSLESSGMTARQVMDTVESELHITGNLGKGEEGEILMGKVLAFGVMVRSGALAAAAPEDQASAVTQLLKDIKGKSYLPLVGDPFLIDYLKQIDEPLFKKTVWPGLRAEVSQGPGQTLLIYHALLVCEERFPSTVSSKFLQQILGTPKVLSPSTVPSLLTALKDNFKLKVINHPAYSDILKYLATAPEDMLVCFWQEVEAQLLVDSSSSSNKQIMAIKFFSLIVSQLQNASQVLNLLTPKLLLWFMKKHKVSGYLQKILNAGCKEALENVCKLCANLDSSKTIISIIKKLLFDPGNTQFEQLSGTRVVQQLMMQMKEKGVLKLAKIFRAVITGSSCAVEHTNSETTTRAWHNNEKLYMVHLLCRLVSLPATQANTQWRLEQLTFLFDIGFFSTSTVGVEFAAHIRESFFSSLNHKQANLVNLRNILAGVVEHTNKRIDNGDQLRVKLTPEIMPAWKKMYVTAKQIGEDNKKHKKEQWVTSVFQTMFYHIGLHLFKEAAFATDVLKELHSVYERVGSSASTNEEPHWTEVVVEMFLSLLSRNSQLHRHLIGCIFSHFCPVMIPQNIHQILQVLDPTSDTNPLLNSLDNDSETSSDNEESDVIEDDNDDDNESSDDDFSDEEEEEDEKANDKLRRAVVEALGDTGATTDVESVDLDDMDEEEAARVDKALSLAFKESIQGKTKKQTSHAKALTHFRLRVIDLIEVWLGSEPPLDLIVDTLLRLLSLLQHSLVDRYQAPLETRLRTVIKRLAAIKKYDVSECKSLHLGEILKSLLEKGDRTTTVYMSISKELTASTLFIVKASQHINNVDESDAEEDSANVSVLSVLKNSVEGFFLQRDCLLNVGLFENLFKLSLPAICSLAAKLPTYVFDPSVHPFRRRKALEFLMIFWKNNRMLLEASDVYSVKLRKMCKRLQKGSVKMMEGPVVKLQPRFIILLINAFKLINDKKWLSDVDWPQHIQALTAFQKAQVNAKNKKQANIEQKDSPEVNEEMDVGSNYESEHEDSQSEHAEESATEEENGSLYKEEETNSVGEGEKKEEPGEETRLSDSLESPTKKSKKTDRKKKNHEKAKRTQLLKNNSKRLRLESMGVGLDDNVFSKYKMLLNNVASPER